jgi:hypothetical protein
MAKKPKKHPMKPIVPSVPAEAYVRLRTMLDSLEIGAIRYYLMAGDLPGKQHRYIQLDEKLMPIVKWLWGDEPGKMMVAAGGPDVECPAGYIDCNGCCVPYPCPDPGGGPMPTPKPKPKPKPKG